MVYAMPERRVAASRDGPAEKKRSAPNHEWCAKSKMDPLGATDQVT
jgi:hypothetical protein